MTRVTMLTPPGTGAIATVEVSGPRAWAFARQLFRPAGKPLPEVPELHRFWFGTLGGDEVILAATEVGPLPCGRGSPTSDEPRPQGSGPACTVEVHCHGGRRVVRWVVGQFLALGCAEDQASGGREPPETGSLGGLTPPARLLPFAATLRTASILLDQLHGAFDAAVRRILELIPSDLPAALRSLRDLTAFSPVGRHLVEPWKVVVAGPPNAGKSSLVNALAGFQRAVVSEVAGTTRDVVRVQVAFDGWPVELTDTAGLRDAEGLEAEGIDRANRAAAEADLVVWIIDATDPAEPDPPGRLVVWNKADLATLRGFAVSALTGFGVPELAAEIARRLVPEAPAPGAAVPYTPRLAGLVEAAHEALVRHRPEETARLLRDCLHAG